MKRSSGDESILEPIPAAAELAKVSKLRIGSESKNREEARELRLVSSAISKSPTGMPSFNKELMSLRAPKKHERKIVVH